MVVDDPHKALHLLGEHGILAIERDVLMLEGRSKPGKLAGIAQILADKGINIEYAYSATSPTATKGVMILRVSDVAKAKRVLRSY